MLHRLKVDGFKNLDAVDVRFGPFTCIVGANGVGKSNLFDAIAFLSALADKPLVEAAAAVRGTEGRVGDVRSLFRRTGNDRASEMHFVAEMIVPETGLDDLGSTAKAGMTFLRYELRLRLREEAGTLGPLEVVHEAMDHINRTGAHEALGFPHSAARRDSVLKGRRTVPYIETEVENDKTIILTRADSEEGLGGGGPRRVLAANMPRTVLSTANNAAEYRTLVLARKEMMGWTQFQLEPSALREPDPVSALSRVAPNGAHLPATLHGLARETERLGVDTAEDVYQQVANRLAGPFENVRTLHVDRDEKREILSIVLTDLDRTDHLASSLSDGTLRFLALAILEATAHGPTLLCLEEPENGIHPDRIPAMITLLRDIAVDPTIAVGPTNPMRQVFVNTHSAKVVNEVPEDALVVGESVVTSQNGRRTRQLRLSGLRHTWRAQEDGASIATLFGYLPVPRPRANHLPGRKTERRIGDREDVQQVIPFTHAPPGRGRDRRVARRRAYRPLPSSDPGVGAPTRDKSTTNATCFLSRRLPAAKHVPPNSNSARRWPSPAQSPGSKWLLPGVCGEKPPGREWPNLVGWDSTASGLARPQLAVGHTLPDQALPLREAECFAELSGDGHLPTFGHHRHVGGSAHAQRDHAVSSCQPTNARRTPMLGAPLGEEPPTHHPGTASTRCAAVAPRPLRRTAP